MRTYLLMTVAVAAGIAAMHAAPAYTADNDNINQMVESKKASSEQPAVNLATNKPAEGRISVKADVGYLYRFAGKGSNDNLSAMIGYGASVEYTHQSGFGLAVSYLAFSNKFLMDGNNYDQPFQMLTFTPSFRLGLDENKQWGLRLGLGVAVSRAGKHESKTKYHDDDAGLGDKTETEENHRKDTGVLLVPQLALEYDNGIFHGDLNVRYFHALNNVHNDSMADPSVKNYNLQIGPMGIFAGVGLGVNF
ncbi:MAG: hypothetical protein ORN57_04125 [Alphaproteobacteria bacterium]|nr:hypothetical protein [Alphaproteobacteria bacterium]